MRTITSIALIALFAFESANAEKEFTYDKKESFDGGAINSITIEMNRGDITIEKSQGANIEVFYKNSIFADNQSDADDINEDYKFSAKANGNKLTVTVDTPRNGRHNRGIVERIIEGDWSEDGSYPMIKLSIPDGKILEIFSASSDIDISELAVDLDIQSASSDIALENAEGKFQCDVSSGDIDISGHKGAISVKGKSSDIRIVDTEGEIDAVTASGDIVIEKAKGAVRVSTTSGDIHLMDIDGDLGVTTISGDVAGSAITGSLTASAISGDVRLDGLMSKEGDYDVTSVSGDIYMEISRDFAGEVSLRSISGAVSSRMPGEIESYSDSRMEGRTGEGKGRLNVSSTSGDITIDRF
jgi:DUF4097 and DUF4098 domain-containing protein YvlB